MTTPIHAIYEGGVFKPTEPVDLPEHCPVKVEPVSGQSEIAGSAESEEFWVEKSLDELATEQGVSVISDWNEVFGSARGLWDSDESFDDFLGVA
ncbi:antitoxin family protein [bacterium]|nr:antitoxin family protein [bacterium]